MNMQLKPVMVIAFVFLYSGIYSQELSIGDTIPNREIAVSNYNKSAINLSEFKEKSIILDFWSRYCVNCFKSFPRIDSLQKEFNGKLQFILICEESKTLMDNFLSKRKNIVLPDIPRIYGDTLFNKLFPHSGVPYHIWISNTGIVTYMTYGHNATSENVQDFLAGKQLKVDNFDRIKFVPSLFDTSRIVALEYFSYLTHCITGVQLSSVPKKNHEQLIYSCASPLYLLIKAFDENGKYELEKAGRVIVESNNAENIEPPDNANLLDEWENKNNYNYQLLVPLKKSDEKYSIMQSDLTRYFNLEARMERRLTKCLILIKTDEIDKLKSKGGFSKNTFYQTSYYTKGNDSLRELINKPYQSFIKLLSNYIENNFRIPFIDVTGFPLKEKIDIIFKGDIIDNVNLANLNSELNRYHLMIVEMQYPLNVLIISDKKE